MRWRLMWHSARRCTLPRAHLCADPELAAVGRCGSVRLCGAGHVVVACCKLRVVCGRMLHLGSAALCRCGSVGLCGTR
jgi:hypothetical protein